MRSLLRSLALLCLLTLGCREEGPSTSQRVSVDLAKECPLSARALDARRKVASWSIFGPEHVTSMVPAAPLYEGEIAVLVTLSQDGRRRMLRYTKQHVKGSIVFLCGENEISSVYITAPVEEAFRVSIPKADT